jgi:hypothetical protein
LAKLFGEKSKYLIWMDYASRLGAVVVYLVFAYTIYSYITINLARAASVLSILVATTMYVPLVWWIKKELNKYLKDAYNYKIGRNAEYEICDELVSALPENYSVFQDIKLPGKKENVDLVVIGKTGIFAIEVKSHTGKITFENGNLLHRGFEFREKNIMHQTMKSAVDLNAYLKNTTGRYFHVNPILAFSSRFASMHFGFNKVRNINIVQKRYLVGLIMAGDGNLSVDEMALIQADLNKLTFENRYKISQSHV